MKYIQIIFGLLLADILTGVFHWIEDTYIDYCCKIPGLQNIARDNELHHYFPRALLQKSYFVNVKDNLIIAFVLFFLFYLFFKKTIVRYPYLFIPMFLFGSVASLFHRFSHERECESIFIIYKLQSIGILVSHDHHKLHHTTETDGKYCAIFQITNYILDSIHFWRFLEKIVGLFGLKPSRKPSYEDYKTIHNYMHENAKAKCPVHPTKEDLDELYQNLDTFMDCN